MSAASTDVAHLNLAGRVGAAFASRPAWLALVIIALVTAVRLTGTVDSDVAWQLWIAHQLNHGAVLYRDIIETNPPLWFWMALPIDGLATALGVRLEAVLVLAMGALVMLSILASAPLLRDLSEKRRLMLLAYAALTLAAMPWAHIGQREQIVLIAAWPYAALIAQRRDGRPVGSLLAALIGVGAGLGFALKHYFLLAPALLELWLMVAQRRSWRILRPETIAIVAIGGLYAGALLIFAPHYFTDVLPMLRLAYGDVQPPGFQFLLKPPLIVGVATFAAIAAHHRLFARTAAPLTMACAIAASAFAAAYFIQYKGWVYHLIPFAGLASIALAALLAETRRPPTGLRLVAPALLLLPFAATAEESARKLWPTPDLSAAVSDLTPGTPVGFLTEDTAVAWSVTLQHQLGYSSRYNGFWMLRAVNRNEVAGGRDPRLAALGRRVVRETVADFRCMPPRRIIVSRPQPGSWNENSLDPLPFFLRDPEFAELLGHYKVVSRTSVEVYELARPPLPKPASACRRAA